jgi:heavy metal sensor kinase
MLVYLRLEADLRAAADDGLLPRAAALEEAPPNGPTLETDPTDVGDVFGQILTRDGTVLSTTSGLASGPIVPTTGFGGLDGPHYFDALVSMTDEPQLARLLEMPTADGRVVVVGVAFDDQREALDRLLILLGLAGPVAILLAGAVGWLVAGAALRPVERMRVEAEAVSASEPGRRLPLPRARDEVAALGRSLNRMLDRLEAAVERERRFVADASHELRTPLANLKAELDLALRRARSPAELVDALRSASEETDRLSQLAEDLLLLASADGGHLVMRLDDIDASGVVRNTVGSFEGRAAALGVTLEASVEDHIRARLDDVRIRQAVRNLVDNALRQTPSGGRVTVEMSKRAGILSIAVADTGSGFETAYLPLAFEAFSRADESRSRAIGGVGLGLAIVRAIAQAHGGTVDARNRPEGGAEVVLELPA